MPELPEVEILVRHLAPLLRGQTIRGVEVRRAKFIAPTSERELQHALKGATFNDVTRRGKYLLFNLRAPGKREPLTLVGHLGMTGRIFLQPKNVPLPKHAAVTLDLGKHHCVFEDTRYFGRLTLDASGLAKLGPEPLGAEFTAEYFASALKRSRQAIKVKLLDQTLVAGVGNIYASEALYRAGISPRLSAAKLTVAQVGKLRLAIREVLAAAIRTGSTLPLDFAGAGERDGLFYYGSASGGSDFQQERLLVYDRLGKPCGKCGTDIRRLVQAARSTYYCPGCQPLRPGKIS
jgi:formamidopyrimidine-DNA glycosylase